jgi:hypothetical protein
VDECTGLENRKGLTPLGGSNPPVSAFRVVYSSCGEQKRSYPIYYLRR